MTNPRRNGLTSVADQSEEERGGPGSILSRQSADHAELDALMLAREAEPDVDTRGRIVAELAERALRHAFAEETVLFPAYRRHLPGDRDELSAHIEGDHQQVNDLLQDLQRADPRSPGYDGEVRRVFEVIRHDATTRRTTCCLGCSRWPAPGSCASSAPRGRRPDVVRPPDPTRRCPVTLPATSSPGSGWRCPTGSRTPSITGRRPAPPAGPRVREFWPVWSQRR